jgi:hypothetical protein
VTHPVHLRWWVLLSLALTIPISIDYYYGVLNRS